ncbi:MAG: tetratricopeptide repeat protein, partial [Coleofasciculaceae cyanobacterium SM2_1_6]|nr:tetratricopeptide repeat protein [Coleofasciculaceae cyanobacterium SM2_1_6]
KKRSSSLDKALEIKPDYYEGWDTQSILLVDLGKYEEAIICCKKSLKIKPDNYKAWKLQGFVLRILRKYKEAIASLDKALEIYREIGLRKDEADTLKQLAEAHQALGEVEVARQYCQQALALATELGIPLAQSARLCY